MVKDLYRIPNHAQRAISLLASQFGNSERIKALLRVFCAQVQSLQNLAQNLYDFRSLSDDPDYYAIGAQLDGLGQILNTPRMQGEEDNEYRERLRNRSYIFFSSGTPEQVMEILKVDSKATYVRYYDIFPAAYQMFTNGGLNYPDNRLLPVEKQVSHNQVSKILLNASPAAVQYVPIACSYGEEDVFQFQDDTRERPLFVNTLTDEEVPLYREPVGPPEYQYYINDGTFDDSLQNGGFADLSNYFVLQLDDLGLLILDDNSNLLLYETDGSGETPGSGHLAELLYYNGAP